MMSHCKRRILGLLLPAATVLLLASGCGSGGGPNVILILIDTLRADHVHCYGYERMITPHLDSLASQGVRWTDCQAQSSWTLPAMTSIFTGTTERAHGAGARGERLYGIGEELVTLPEAYSAMGYSTYGIYNAPVMDVEYGFASGVDSVDTEGCTDVLDAEVVVDRTLSWIDSDADGPFFAVAHFFDPHWPYCAPDGPQDLADVPASAIRAANAHGDLNRDQAIALIDYYDAEIRYCDRELGRLFAGLRERGLDENTIVVVVADHGEEFLDHGMMFHGRQLFQETVHVPLIISGPGVPRGDVVTEVVGQYDIMPTLMHLTDGQVPRQVQGVSLLPAAASPHEGVPSSGVNTGLKQRAAVRFDSLKVLWDADADSSWTYDLSLGIEDPDEALTPDSAHVEKVQRYWSTPYITEPPHVEVGDEKARWFRDMAYI
mgnify:CR=1 FL=1